MERPDVVGYVSAGRGLFWQRRRGRNVTQQAGGSGKRASRFLLVAQFDVRRIKGRLPPVPCRQPVRFGNLGVAFP